MQRSTIIALAGLCGVAAFLWTLAAHPPPGSYPSSQDPVFTAGASAGNFPTAPRADAGPRSLAALEQVVLERSASPRDWFDLARRREAAGLPAESAWRTAADLALAATRAEPRPRFPWYILACAREKLGEADLALEAYRTCEPLLAESVRTGQNLGAHMRLGWTRRKLGDETGAQAAWSSALEIVKHTHPTELGGDGHYTLACLLALTNQPDTALIALQSAAGHRYADAQWAAYDESLAPLRADPGFATILFKMHENESRKRAGE